EVEGHVARHDHARGGHAQVLGEEQVHHEPEADGDGEQIRHGASTELWRRASRSSSPTPPMLPSPTTSPPSPHSRPSRARMVSALSCSATWRCPRSSPPRSAARVKNCVALPTTT